MKIQVLITNLDQDIREREAKLQVKMNPRSTGYMEDDEKLVFITERECERQHLRQLQSILDQLLLVDGVMQEPVTTAPEPTSMPETTTSLDSLFNHK